ncbi:MAG: Membrane metalloprotease [Labilithrix sp.]|nr:Membrane metalloprotease [Labilithrix sp.]
MSLRTVVSLLLASVLAASCSSSSSSGGASSSSSSGASGTSGTAGTPASTKLFAKGVEKVVVEIDYAPGAEPFPGPVQKFGDPWLLATSNVRAIFDGKKKTEVPTTLAAMEKLGDVAAKDVTVDDILAIAAAHRTAQAFDNVATFYVVFVNGHFIDEAGAVQPDQLGVSIGDTGVIAIFKPAVTSPLVEQVALLHQLGHAVGFVDHGVPVKEENRRHVDADGRHCSNAACVMSAAVERTAGAEAFAKKSIPNADAVLIGQDCLSDARILENAL